MGLTPAMGMRGHDQEDLGAGDTADKSPSYTPQFPRSSRLGDSVLGRSIPLHSPLLRESSLVSFPPLSYMLKFSGYSRLI